MYFIVQCAKFFCGLWNEKKIQSLKLEEKLTLKRKYAETDVPVLLHFVTNKKVLIMINTKKPKKIVIICL